MKYIMLLLCLVFSGILCFSQPKQSSKQVLEGLTLYQDLKKENLYYYAPGKLRLAKESDGAPKFQIVFTRYLGTRCGGDQGEKQFLNLVQFTVRMDRFEARELRAAKLKLGTDATLRPLPIQNVEAFLVAPVGDRYQRLGGVGSSEANSENGTSSKRNFWTERTFTLRLANDEAQLLQNLMTDDKLALSINYSFYADVVADIETSLDIDGSIGSKLLKLEKKLENLLPQDSIPVLQAVVGGAFPVAVDFDAYPQKLKKIDINEAGIPTDYPALELRCYDFANELRPDLNMKEIRIKALGVGGSRWIEMPPITFSRFQPDLNVQQLMFSQAVKMGADFRYQIIEHPREGEQRSTGWQSISSCSSLLDISTDLKAAGLNKQLLDIEVPADVFSEHKLAAMTLVLNYTLRGQDLQQFQVFEPNTSASYKQLSVLHDIGTELSYQIVWHYSETVAKVKELTKLDSDAYIYCKIPS